MKGKNTAGLTESKKQASKSRLQPIKHKENPLVKQIDEAPAEEIARALQTLMHRDEL